MNRLQKWTMFAATIALAITIPAAQSNAEDIDDQTVLGILSGGQHLSTMYLFEFEETGDGFSASMIFQTNPFLTFNFTAHRFWSNPTIYSWHSDVGLYGWIWEDPDGTLNWSSTYPYLLDNGTAEFF